MSFLVDSPTVQYTEEHILSSYTYRNTKVKRNHDGSLSVKPSQTQYEFKIKRTVPKVGLMMVGWGGNNGSTLTAGIISNRKKLSWRTKDGTQCANYYGSITQASTIELGLDDDNKPVYIPFRDILPMVEPNDLILGGWDISSIDLAHAMRRAKVLEPTLVEKLWDDMKTLKPLPSIYYPQYIAANQEDRADNLMDVEGKWNHVLKIKQDIKDFKSANHLDKVIVVWTANTERFSNIIPGVNDNSENLLQSIKNDHEEISPSTIFGVACVLSNVPFINGSPQNTFVPGLVELAEIYNVHIAGDDFKSGQTKLKSVLVDFLVNAGIKPVAITSYNHLGNNDGRNLSAPEQFRSKEISKANVVDDMVAANNILYQPGEHPDHTIVIKYVPSVGDSKRALDEYVSEIFMGGKSNISIVNICEDSLLASPLILDLTILCELMTRIEYRTGEMEDFSAFHPVLSILSYMLKAPLVTSGAPVVNALNSQKSALENLFKACLGLSPQSHMKLEHQWHHSQKLRNFGVKI